MRKLAAALMIVVVVMILSGNAFAEESLYKSGNIAVGVGYSASNYNISNTTANGGFMLQTSYFITDNWAVNGQYYSNSLSSMGTNIGENIIALNLVRHLGITDTFGMYSSIGYGNATFHFPTIATSGGGLMLELGIEAKFSPNLAGFAGYRAISPSNRAVTIGYYRNDGFNVGMNVIF